jgi:hypothetical protein
MRRVSPNRVGIGVAVAPAGGTALRQAQGSPTRRRPTLN